MSKLKVNEIEPVSGDVLNIKTTSVSRLYIDASGKVGIGTVTPTKTLDVVGTAKMDVLIVNGGYSVINTTTTNSPPTQTFTNAGGLANNNVWLVGRFNFLNGNNRIRMRCHVTAGSMKENLEYNWIFSGSDYDGGVNINNITEWLELPVVGAFEYGTRIKFDVRRRIQMWTTAQTFDLPNCYMELRMRIVDSSETAASTSCTLYTVLEIMGNTVFTQNQTNMGVNHSEANGVVNGFHANDRYEFPVGVRHIASNKGLYINNNGNVGIGITGPSVALDVVGEARSSTSTTEGSNANTLVTKDYVAKPVLQRGAASVVGRMVSLYTMTSAAGGTYSTTPLDAGVWEIHVAMTENNSSDNDEDVLFAYHTIATVPINNFLTYKLTGLAGTSTAMGLQYRLQSSAMSAAHPNASPLWENIGMTNVIGAATDLSSDPIIDTSGIKHGLVGYPPPSSGTNANTVAILCGYAKRIS